MTIYVQNAKAFREAVTNEVRDGTIYCKAGPILDLFECVDRQAEEIAELQLKLKAIHAEVGTSSVVQSAPIMALIGELTEAGEIDTPRPRELLHLVFDWFASKTDKQQRKMNHNMWIGLAEELGREDEIGHLLPSQTLT